jgi:hypothetical protein
MLQIPHLFLYREEDVRRTAKMSRSGGFDRSNALWHPYDNHKTHTAQNRKYIMTKFFSGFPFLPK